MREEEAEEQARSGALRGPACRLPLPQVPAVGVKTLSGRKVATDALQTAEG